MEDRAKELKRNREHVADTRAYLGSLRLLCFLSALLVVGAWPVRAHEGLYEQLVIVTQQMRKDPGNAAFHLKRGELYRLLQQWDNALADYKRAQQLKPELSEVDFYRGRMWFEAGEHQKARAALAAFLARAPAHSEALLVRARASERLKDYRASIADYSRALSLLSRPKPDYFIERAKVQLASGQPAEALRGIDEAIERLGPLITLQTQAIEIERQQRHWDGALARLERLTEQAPRQESYLAWRGEILLQAGRATAAHAAFAESLRAIEALPLRLRQTKAMLELEKRVRAALQ